MNEAEKICRVVYQGTEGAYSTLAAAKYFRARNIEFQLNGHPTFQSLMKAVRDGEADYGMLPLENSTAGSINEAYDLLAEMDLKMVGEEICRVNHCLLALENIPITQIRRIFSHPQALLQCSRYLQTLNDCEIEGYIDTAMAARKIRDDGDHSQAAIAGEHAAKLYGLTVIKRDIANQPENFTRFAVVAKRPETFDIQIPCKTSLLFSTKHEKGALVACLKVLSDAGFNLTKLESRPIPHVPWEYVFYADFEGNLEEPEVQAALKEMTTRTTFLKVLGCYPIGTT
jgi:chorismate mutase/prephenate dehydratase